MTNPAPLRVQWLFDEEATRFLKDQGFSDEVENQTVQHPPDIGDWVSWAWVADNQPFEVGSRWFMWTADRQSAVQIFLSIPQTD